MVAAMTQRLFLQENTQALPRPYQPAESRAARSVRLQSIFCSGACHEIYPETGGHALAATSLSLLLAQQCAMARPVIWIRQSFLTNEIGLPSPSGLAELGLQINAWTLAQTPDVKTALQAGFDAVRCEAIGAVVIEIWGETKLFDFTASRRFALATKAFGTTLFIARQAAHTHASAAMSRWQARMMPSRALMPHAPGMPAFNLTLLRHRGGLAPAQSHVEWNRDQKCFEELNASSASDRHASSGAPLSRYMVPVPRSRPHRDHNALLRAG